MLIVVSPVSGCRRLGRSLASERELVSEAGFGPHLPGCIDPEAPSCGYSRHPSVEECGRIGASGFWALCDSNTRPPACLVRSHSVFFGTLQSAFRDPFEVLELAGRVSVVGHHSRGGVPELISQLPFPNPGDNRIRPVAVTKAVWTELGPCRIEAKAGGPAIHVSRKGMPIPGRSVAIREDVFFQMAGPIEILQESQSWLVEANDAGDWFFGLIDSFVCLADDDAVLKIDLFPNQLSHLDRSGAGSPQEEYGSAKRPGASAHQGYVLGMRCRPSFAATLHSLGKSVRAGLDKLFVFGPEKCSNDATNDSAASPVRNPGRMRFNPFGQIVLTATQKRLVAVMLREGHQVSIGIFVGLRTQVTRISAPKQVAQVERDDLAHGEVSHGNRQIEILPVLQAGSSPRCGKRFHSAATHFCSAIRQ